MKFIIASLLVLAACHKEVKSEEKLEETTAVATELRATWEDDPTIVDFHEVREDNAIVVQQADGAVVIAQLKPGKPLRLPKGAKPVGVVPVVSTVTDQDTHEGGKRGEEEVKKQEEKKLDIKKQEERKLDVGSKLDFYIYISIILLMVSAAGYVYFKFVKKVSWL